MAEAAFVNTWSKNEDQALRDSYGKVEAKALARQLGRSECAVMHRAQRIGATARRRWTEEDKQTLRALWGEKSLGRIASELKRTVKTVYPRAKMLGLQLGCPRGLEYLTAAAARTGYQADQLRVILKAQGVKMLPSYSRPTGAKRHYDVVDPQDVDDAIARHLESAPVQQHARDYGVSGDCMRFWLLRAKADGFAVPEPPVRARCYWLVPTKLVAEIMAWRETLETVRQGSKRVRIDAQTLRKRLEDAGVKRSSERPWWVAKTDVDRVAGWRRRQRSRS